MGHNIWLNPLNVSVTLSFPPLARVAVFLPFLRYPRVIITTPRSVWPLEGHSVRTRGPCWQMRLYLLAGFTWAVNPWDAKKSLQCNTGVCKLAEMLNRTATACKSALAIAAHEWSLQTLTISASIMRQEAVPYLPQLTAMSLTQGSEHFIYKVPSPSSQGKT